LGRYHPPPPYQLFLTYEVAPKVRKPEHHSLCFLDQLCNVFSMFPIRPCSAFRAWSCVYDGLGLVTLHHLHAQQLFHVNNVTLHLQLFSSHNSQASPTYHQHSTRDYHES
jgi:hypothetical protein